MMNIIFSQHEKVVSFAIVLQFQKGYTSIDMCTILVSLYTVIFAYLVGLLTNINCTYIRICHYFHTNRSVESVRPVLSSYCCNLNVHIVVNKVRIRGSVMSVRNNHVASLYEKFDQS